jgi:hypothetical protein
MRTARRLSLAAVLALVAGAASGGAQAQSLIWSGQASLGNELSERGVAVWHGRAVAQGVVALSDGANWSAALSAAGPLGGDADNRGAQLALHGAVYAPLSPDWQLQTGLAVYTYPGAGAHRYDRADAMLGAAYRDLASLELSASRVNDEGAHWYPALELGLRWPVSSHWALAAGLGRAELTNWPGTWYGYVDLGLRWQAGPWGASLGHLRASQAARRYVPDAAGPRTALSLTRSF